MVLLPAGRGRLEERIVGSSPAVREMCKTLGRVLATDAAVLITGERIAVAEYVIAVQLPTLRGRKDDIPLFVEHFLQLSP